MQVLNFIIHARRVSFSIVALALTLLSGCATGPQANPNDPLEPLNRGVFAFNEGVDQAVLKPVAQGYRAITPQPIRAGISNFYNNLQDLWTGINAVLQLRPTIAVESFMPRSLS